ncbi:MAG: hypothetical protein NXY59_04330 [Aigarchaeota archaeon]|nr:hypothetical protein [Candidatus Pelearchaeum maunauluense]
MARLAVKTRIEAEQERVFNIITTPDNMAKLYPPEMRVKVIDAPSTLYLGADIELKLHILHQPFRVKFRVIGYERPNKIELVAIDSPFKKWSHTHILSHENHGFTTLEDIIEIQSFQGPLFDSLAIRMIGRVFDYRNAVLRSLITGEARLPEFGYVFTMSLLSGSILSAIGIAVGLWLLALLPTNIPVIDLIISFGVFFLLWFFTHDLAHLLVGLLTGVRFKFYYVGLSNIVVILPRRAKLLPIVLGLRIDRDSSAAGGLGYAMMYLAGPLASMLAPLSAALLMMIRNPESVASLFLFTVSLANIVFTLVFSPRVGCIRKAVRAVGRVG